MPLLQYLEIKQKALFRLTLLLLHSSLFDRKPCAFFRWMAGRSSSRRQRVRHGKRQGQKRRSCGGTGRFSLLRKYRPYLLALSRPVAPNCFKTLRAERASVLASFLQTSFGGLPPPIHALTWLHLMVGFPSVRNRTRLAERWKPLGRDGYRLGV